MHPRNRLEKILTLTSLYLSHRQPHWTVLPGTFHWLLKYYPGEWGPGSETPHLVRDCANGNLKDPDDHFEIYRTVATLNLVHACYPAFGDPAGLFSHGYFDPWCVLSDYLGPKTIQCKQHLKLHHSLTTCRVAVIQADSNHDSKVWQ